MKALVLAAGLILAAPAAHAGAGETVSIEINEFAFTPKEVTVAPGSTIVWTNRDETPHTVSASDKAFASPALDTDDRYRRTFNAAGDYAYFCTLHPFMTAVVHVRGAPVRDSGAGQ